MPRAFTPIEHEHIRNRLLDTGGALFGHRGIRKTSVEELARAAGISKGAFYRFFGSKEEMYFALLDRAQKRFKTDVREAVSRGSGDPLRDLKAVLRKALQVWLDDPLSARLDSDDLEYVLRKMPPELIRRHMADDSSFAAFLVEACGGTGLRANVDPRLVAGLLRAVFFVSLHEERFDPEIFPQLIDVLFELVAGFIASGAPRNAEG